MKHKEGLKLIGYIVVFVFLLAFGLSIYSYTQEPEVKAPASEGEVSEYITLDFKDADIKSVLHVIARRAAINIVATPEVRGLVTIRLENIPWEQALDTIVKTYGFGYEWVNPNVIMVSTLERLAEQRRIEEEAAAREPVDTQTFTLNFSRAADIQLAIERLITARGRSSLELRTNTLIITDTKSNLVRLGQIIRDLDRITPQVMIEARIIETTLGSDERLGIDWTMKIAASGAKRPTNLPFGQDKWDKNFFPGEFPAPASTVEAGFVTGDFTFGTLDFSQFRAVLEILDQRTDANVISNPRITALNNQEARIKVGTIIPIPLYRFSEEAGTAFITGFEEMEIGVELLVTPNINEEGYITLDVKPTVEGIIRFVAGATAEDERPVIAKRSAQTRVMIKDGDTLVIGGLISENKLKSRSKVPLLGDIPLLGLFFSKREDKIEKTELLIFLTPRVIQEGALIMEAKEAGL